MSRGCPFLDGEGGREINLNSGEFGWSNVVVNHCENCEFRDYVIVLSFLFFFQGKLISILSRNWISPLELDLNDFDLM